MRIVSQNRDLSLNFDDIDIFICDMSICTTYHDKPRVLGKYASEERAREVFEEIHNAENVESKMEQNTRGIFITAKSKNTFYMPEE